MKHFKKYLTGENLLVVGILLVAAFFRFFKIDQYLTFLGDEGRDVLVVWKILHGDPTLLGPTASVGGFFLGPIYYYFMAPFLWLFNYNPVGPAIMVATVGVITVWFIYKVGKEFFNSEAGIIAAVLYAISPLVITYSRSSWNPNLMPIFSLLTLYTTYKAVLKKSWKLYITSGILLGICLQLHYIEVILGAIIIIYLLLTSLIFNKTQKIGAKLFELMKQYLLGLGGFIIGFSPFLAFEVLHQFPNIKSILNFVFKSEEVTNKGDFIGIIDNVFFRLFGRLITNYPQPETVSPQAHIEYAIWYYATIILALSSVFFLFSSLYSSVVKKQENKLFQYLLLLTWLLIGVYLFGFYKKQIYDYYFEFMFPLPFLIIGGFFSYLWNKKFILRVVSIIIVVILIITNYIGSPIHKAPNNQLGQVKGIAEFVMSKTDNKPFNFALITGGNSDHAYRYWFTVWGRPPVTIEFPGIDPQRKSVTEQLLIVCEQEQCAPLGNSLWEIAGFGRAEIVGEWKVSVVKVYKLKHLKEN